MVLQAMAVASVKQSCESILESFFSKYKNNFDERRNVHETNANEEFEICVNGPNLANSEAVVKEAMDLHWVGSPGTSTELLGWTSLSTPLEFPTPSRG